MAKPKKEKKENELSNLAFQKVIEPNHGYMYEIDEAGNKNKLMVKRVSVLGVGGAYGIEEVNASSGNIQEIEVCHLSENAERLRVEVTCRINGVNAGIPNICNIRETCRKLSDIYGKYWQAGGISMLSQSYLARLAEGAFLWRNNVGYDRVVTVKARNFATGEVAEFIFDKPKYFDETNPVQPVSDPEVIRLAKFCESGFFKNTISLDVATELTIGRGQEVYPSQEMNMSSDKNAPSRIFAKSADGQAMIHSQKIGNALRRIDCWHGDPDFGAIAVEPYGSVINRASALRYGKDSFYVYLDGVHTAEAGQWGPFDDLKSASSLQDLNKIAGLHYFIAMLIRGGVLGLKNSSDEKTESTE